MYLKVNYDVIKQVYSLARTIKQTKWRHVVYQKERKSWLF